MRERYNIYLKKKDIQNNLINPVTKKFKTFNTLGIIGYSFFIFIIIILMLVAVGNKPYSDYKIPDNQKCTIFMEDGNEYEIVSSISKLKEKLGASFYQTHKSCLVNVEKIKKINYHEGTITFNNNQTLYLLSTRNKKGLREYVANY